MTDLINSLAVSVAELGTLTSALPTFLGDGHESTDLVRGALADVGAGLFSATRSAIDDDPATATTTAVAQLKALRSVQQLISELSPAPAFPADLDDSLELVCGLLELCTEAGRA